MSRSISTTKKKQATEGEEKEKSRVPRNYWRFTVTIHLAITINPYTSCLMAAYYVATPV
jgi:hypothetical protein